MKNTILITIFIVIIIFCGCTSQKETHEISNNNSSQTIESNHELLSADIGGSQNTEFTNTFITIPRIVYDYIGNEKSSQWYDSLKANADYNENMFLYANIYEYVKYFNISREELESLYYSTNMYYLYDFDFDILFSGNTNKVYERYTADSTDYLKRSTEHSIKTEIASYVGYEKFNNWLVENNRPLEYSDVSWSIPEVIYAFDIPRETVEGIINEFSNYQDFVQIAEVLPDGTEVPLTNNTYVYNYDLDRVYSDSGRQELTELIKSGTQGYKLDEIIRLP